MRGSDVGVPGTVIVVTDANRSRVSVAAATWAIKNLVRPRDTVIVLSVLSEIGKKTTSCSPFQMCISLSGISVKIEFSAHGELSPSELQEEIEKKREDYQFAFHPFYKQCKKNEVKLELKLAAGYDPRRITIQEAQQCHPSWIVLDSHFKKHKQYIYEHVHCNVAVMKKGIASLMPSRESRPPSNNPSPHHSSESIGEVDHTPEEPDEDHALVPLGKSKTSVMSAQPPRNPSWYPLSWKPGFPRAFTIGEIEMVTNDFAYENLLAADGEKEVYKGVYQETPVLVQRFAPNNERFWLVLKILSRVRHRNILNLVGYCCTDASLFLICDYPCSGDVEMNLLRNELATNLSWRARWYMAQEIGIGLRYLHEECVDGPISDLSIASNHVMFSHGSIAMLNIVNTARRLKDDIPCNQDSPDECRNREEGERLMADMHGYGKFLVELITGKSARLFKEEGLGHSLIDWAVPYLEKGSLSPVMDQRVADNSDAGMVYYMSRAALLCLNSEADQNLSINKVLAVVRGDGGNSS